MFSPLSHGHGSNDTYNITLKQMNHACDTYDWDHGVSEWEIFK